MSKHSILEKKIIVCSRIQRPCPYAYDSEDKHRVLCAKLGGIDVHGARCFLRSVKENGVKHFLL